MPLVHIGHCGTINQAVRKRRRLTSSGPVRYSFRNPNTGLLLGLSALLIAEQSPCRFIADETSGIRKPKTKCGGHRK